VWHLDQLVAVQIDEGELLPAQLGLEPTLGKHEVRVPLVTRASATTTLRAPRCRNASAAAPTSTGFVFTSTPAMYSTKFGLSKTDLPRRFNPNMRSARVSESASPSEYAAAETIATPRSRGSAIAQEHLFRQQLGGRHSAHSKPSGAD